MSIFPMVGLCLSILIQQESRQLAEGTELKTRGNIHIPIRLEYGYFVVNNRILLE